MVQMQTFTGKIVDLQSPTPDVVDIEDVAHALSMICRYGGHCDEFYSVAEHSVVLEEFAARISPKESLFFLLHDAAEAYLGDVVSPLKKVLTSFVELEKLWRMLAIGARYDLSTTPEMEDQLVLLENRLVPHEVWSLFHPVSEYWTRLYQEPEPGQVTIRCWDPREAKRRFLDRFRALQWAIKQEEAEQKG